MKRFSGILLFNHQNKILLGKQKFLGKSIWNCFFGSIEFFDFNSMNAAIREMDEESNMYFKNLQITRVREIGKIKIPFIFESILHIGKIKTTKVPGSSNEYSEFKWFSLNYIPSNIHPGLKLLKKKFKEEITNDRNYKGKLKIFIPKIQTKKF
jgi:hypothetical protein